MPFILAANTPNGPVALGAGATQWIPLGPRTNPAALRSEPDHRAAKGSALVLLAVKCPPPAGATRPTVVFYDSQAGPRTVAPLVAQWVA